MCGINGANFEDRDLIARMNRLTAHRGPDGEGTFFDAHVSLGHNRLAIIDLDPRAAQPMQSEDGRYRIIFNGEIYNYRELKRELSGYPFRTESDTEVILAGYARHGEDFFARMNGIFAFALYDRIAEKLLLVRDPVGVKPLYYRIDGSRLVFSSELRAVLASMDQPTIHREAMELYFDLMYVPGPQTLVHGVEKLPPGCIGVMERGVFSLRQYGAPSAAYPESLVGTVSAAVRRQLVSDRPVGVFLSGGFDSSIVLHHVMEHSGQADTYTVGFALPPGTEAESEKFNADMHLARKTAAHYGTRHHERLILPHEIAEAAPAIFEAMDEPVANATIIPTYFLSEFARKEVVVALDGSGGDELFGGYLWYKASRLFSHLQRLPLPLRRALAKAHPALGKLAAEDVFEWYRSFMGQPSEVLSALLGSGTALGTAHRYLAHRYAQDMTVDVTKLVMEIDRTMWLVDESLMRSDKMSMAHGLELRVPLLDHSVLAYAATIPTSGKVSFFDTKRPLKHAYRDILPSHLFGQPKRGWFAPGAKWLRDDAMTVLMDEVLSPSYNERTAAVFDWESIKTLREKHHVQSGYYSKPLWALLMFQMWARRHNIAFT
jgi:asparagine synthase (glutamine-hydrolysing)